MFDIGIDPLVSYSINKFFLLFIPKAFLENLPSLITAFLATVIPYTPIDVIILCSVFLFIYLTNIFGTASKTVHYCRFNKPENRQEQSIWPALKNTYYVYFLMAMIVNYNTVSQYSMFSVNAI
jgi:hypothetical protein